MKTVRKYGVRRVLAQSLALLGSLLVMLVLASTPVRANIDIADVPLFASTAVEPNILFVIDDSGSMQWETMPDDLTNLFSAACCANYMMWVYPRRDGLHGSGDYNGTRVPSFATTSIMGHVYRSAAINTMYYNPASTYRPWVNADGSFMANAPPTAAPNRPGFPAFGTRNLTVNNTQTARWVENRANAHSAQSRTFYPAVYSTYIGPEITDRNAAINTASDPIWTMTNYSRTEIRVTTPTYTGEGREKRSDCAGAGSSPPVCTYAEEIQNFANWYSYHRNRIFTSRGGIGQAFVDFEDNIRVGYGRINTNANTVDSVSGRAVVRGIRPFIGTNKQAFYDNLYQDPIPPQGTPLRRALDGAGQYFSRMDARGPWSTTPGQLGGEDLSCRQSFSILMTDGSASGGTANQASTGGARANTDGSTDGSLLNVHPDDIALNFSYSPVDPYQDTRSGTLADVAMYYWKRNLRPDLPNEVPTSNRNEAFWQHMVTYGVGLGVAGSIDPDTAWQAVADGTPIAWPNPAYNYGNCGAGPVGTCANRIDDVLHAGVNSRGGFFSAADPDTFASELRAVVADIVARVTTSSTSAATSSAVLQTDTLLYSALFRSDDWSGNIRAFEIDDDDGTVAEELWSAEAELAGRTAPRSLLTHDGSTGRLLQLAQLSAAQVAALNHNADGIDDGLAADRIAWLRGQSPAGLRSRTSIEGLRLIGDIVGGIPVYLGKPNRGYYLLPPTFQPAEYNTYRLGIASRKDLLIVAANGGMLHGFDALTGEELFGYVPSEILLPLEGEDFAPASLLTEVDYQHKFSVDGTPSVSDALIGGAWKTVLVGSMGIGGRTIFALDVTDPENMTTADVLWEFTDPDLGYGVSDVQIVPMANGTFAAVFGNGYNSNSDRAILFVVNISDGSLIAKLDTGEGSALSANGLGPVQTSDWPQSDLVTQVVYAGDIQGNLWRFNLQSTDPADWHGGIHQLFSATDSLGNQQPITVQPRVSVNPDAPGELLISFGTGSYFRDQDRLTGTPQIQTLYGIRDTGSTGTTWTRSDLLQQEITWESVEMALGQQRLVRAISNNEYTAAPNVEKGWYLDLVYNSSAKGERVISRATFPSGSPRQRVRFTTMTPSDDPCKAARQGFIFDIDLATGGPADPAVFDINNDGVFTAADLIDGNVISGIGGGSGEELTVIRNRDGTGDYFYDGGGERVGEGSNPEGRASDDPVGRQSWQQLR